MEERDPMNRNPEPTVMVDAPVERPVMVETPVRRESWWTRMMNSTKSYTVELFIAVNALLALSVITAYSLVALFNYIVGIKDGFFSAYMHESSLVLVALLLVLLPVVVLFYARTRGETALNPAQGQRAWHKVILGWYYVHVVSFAVAAGFVVVYSLLQLVAGEPEVKDTLLKVTVPACIVLMYFVTMYFVYGVRRVRRRAVLIALSVVTLVTAVGLLMPTLGHLKDAKYDQKRSEDVKTVAVKIKSYYDDHNNKLPNSLSDVNISPSSLKYKLNDYTYKKDSNSTYQVCADFKTATNDGPAKFPFAQEPEYADYSQHSQGQHCFKLRAGYGPALPAIDDYSAMLKEYMQNFDKSESDITNSSGRTSDLRL